jgi:amino acid adenylation domain-containing protein
MPYLLSQIIEETAARSPEKVALRFNSQGLSYAELVHRANQLAWLLQECGVKKRDRVGVLTRKSLETVVAIYGIMRAGAVYVPLDPLSPLARLQFMIQDCGITHLVTHVEQLEVVKKVMAVESRLSHVFGIPAGKLEGIHSTGWDAVYALPDSKPHDPAVMEHDLAYIMYTSGSTGSPKGLMHTHASGLSYARMSASTYDVQPSDIISNHSPLHFDMSTFDYFTSLLAGAATVIIPEGYAKLPASLSQLIESERMTIWYSVPFALIQLYLRGALHQRDLSSLRWVLFGGEPFPPNYLKGLMAAWPRARFSNVYGPAEVNQCTYYHVPPNFEGESIPIGKVWSNACGIVLGEDDQEVPDNTVGELAVRSPTMMRGYWNQPELNERAFYRHRIFANFEETYYRTGDLVQVQDDGNMKFLGRKDRQIKTRGYRVELDEVEHALSSQPKVEEAAVYPVSGDEGSQQIEAAVVLKAGETIQENDLKRYLGSLLPWYAIPQKILVLNEFPRTGTGKIDRRLLSEKAQASQGKQE